MKDEILKAAERTARRVRTGRGIMRRDLEILACRYFFESTGCKSRTDEVFSKLSSPPRKEPRS